MDEMLTWQLSGYMLLKIRKTVSEYDQEMLQSHTADQPMAS